MTVAFGSFACTFFFVLLSDDLLLIHLLNLCLIVWGSVGGSIFVIVCSRIGLTWVRLVGERLFFLTVHLFKCGCECKVISSVCRWVGLTWVQLC